MNHLTLKKTITGETGASGRKEVEVMVPLKYLCHFQRALEMIINLTQSEKFVVVAITVENHCAAFLITDAKILCSNFMCFIKSR